MLLSNKIADGCTGAPRARVVVGQVLLSRQGDILVVKHGVRRKKQVGGVPAELCSGPVPRVTGYHKRAENSSNKGVASSHVLLQRELLGETGNHTACLSPYG